jgi:hypothetical protein
MADFIAIGGNYQDKYGFISTNGNNKQNKSPTLAVDSRQEHTSDQTRTP